MLGEQLRAYRTRTRLRISEMAALFGLSEAGYNKYERKHKPGSPPLTRAAEAAARMLVSLDWLAGSSTIMWADDLLHPMRTALRKEQPTRSLGKPIGADKRICELLRWTHRVDPKRFDAFVLSAVAPLARGRTKSLDKMAAVLRGEDLKMINPAPDYLAEFWQVSPTWLLKGVGEPFLAGGPHAAALDFLREYGMTHDFLVHHQNVLAAMVADWHEDQQQAAAE